MSALSFLTNWYNVPFLTALVLSLIFSLVQIVGGLGDHDADADVDADVDIDVDVDADVDIDGHVDVDGGGFGEALSVLGVGRVPLLLVLMAFLSSFGIIGLLFNTVLAQSFSDYPPLAILGVLLASLVLGGLLGGRLSRAMHALAPESPGAISYDHLVGRLGTVISNSVSPTYGRVQVRDGHGSLHTVFAVVEGEPIPEHSEVALISYDAKQRCFKVKHMDTRRR